VTLRLTHHLTSTDASPGLPAHLAGDADIEAYLARDGPTSHTATHIVPTLGSHLNVVELGSYFYCPPHWPCLHSPHLAPNGSSQFHRTPSLDYVVVTHGHVRMHTDSGAVLDLHPGDHVVQRATMHKWENVSATEPARLIAVVLPCEAFEIPGGVGECKEVHVHGSEEKGWEWRDVK
jgi:hypothetical protein